MLKDFQNPWLQGKVANNLDSDSVLLSNMHIYEDTILKQSDVLEPTIFENNSTVLGTKKADIDLQTFDRCEQPIGIAEINQVKSRQKDDYYGRLNDNLWPFVSKKYQLRERKFQELMEGQLVSENTVEYTILNYLRKDLWGKNEETNS